MNRFLRPLSVIALLHEVVFFGCLIVTVTVLRIHERLEIYFPPPLISRLLKDFWPVFALIPLAWAVLAVFDESSEDPHLDERQHFWIGVGLLILWTLFGLASVLAAFSSIQPRM